jgi:hypothetical protein
LIAAIFVGVLVSLVFAQSRWIRRMFYPYTILLQTVPIVAVAPLILMWIGPGLLSVMLIAFIICLAPIIANTTQGLISVERNLGERFAGADSAEAAASACDAFALYRDQNLQWNCGDWGYYRGAVRRVGACGCGWTWVRDPVCERAAGDGLLVRAGCGGDGAGIRILLPRDVSGVDVPA